MNVKKFRSILGGVVLTSVESGSPIAPEVIAGVSARIVDLKARDDKENIDPSVEISDLINQIFQAKKSTFAETTSTLTT